MFEISLISLLAAQFVYTVLWNLKTRKDSIQLLRKVDYIFDLVDALEINVDHMRQYYKDLETLDEDEQGIN